IGKQTLWLGIAIGTFVIVYVVEWEFWNSFAFPIYAVTIVLLILVLLVGTEIKGAKSWFSLFGMSFQPSEIAKFTTALAVSSFLSSYKTDIKNRNTLLIALGLIGLPMVLILLQPDAGAAFENLLEPHQQDRINVWLRPEKSDPRGSRYNIIQSKRAIGSGGLKGKGFLQGDMTKLNYVPEQTTDFIFSTVGEEQGFIGSVGVIFLFTLLLSRIVIIAERAKNAFIQNYAYAVAGILFLHFFVNIGMALGLMPVIGIPLPFLSKGGSALLGFTIMISVLLRMDMARFRV
ncbi:unnamed protein product, partial [Cyprideis torosa]